MNDELYELPSGWTWAKMKEIAFVGAGNPAPQGKEYFENGTYPFVRVRDMGELRNDVYIYDTKDHVNEKAIRKMKLFPKGTVLFTKSGMSTVLNQRAILGKDMYVVSHIGIASPVNEIQSEWLYYWLRMIDFKSFIHATTLPSLKLSTVNEIAVPLAPLNEQRRIVAKVKALFAESKTARGALDKVPFLLRRFRQSVLAKAFRGELANREMHDIAASELVNRIKRQKPNTKGPKRAVRRRTVMEVRGSTDLEELPKGWAWVRFEDIASAQNGRSFPSKFYTDKGVRLLRPGNLHISGRVVWTPENTRYLPESFSDQYREFLVGDNEIIMNLTAQSLKDEFLGRVCMTAQGTRYLLNQRQARIRATEAIDTSYLFWVLKSPIFRKFVSGLESGTLIQHMFTWQINELMLPLAPLKEQNSIVRKIEECLSYADEVEKATKVALNRINRIDQSMLSKAFRGELVPQDSNDEPAPILLQRIKTTTKQQTGFQKKLAD